MDVNLDVVVILVVIPDSPSVPVITLDTVIIAVSTPSIGGNDTGNVYLDTIMVYLILSDLEYTELYTCEIKNVIAAMLARGSARATPSAAVSCSMMDAINGIRTRNALSTTDSYASDDMLSYILYCIENRYPVNYNLLGTWCLVEPSTPMS